jgi:hypothetical protein
VDLARFGDRVEQAQVLRGADLLGALDQVTDVVPAGEETLDGTVTQRYDATIDLDDITARLPVGMADGLRERLGGDVPVQVWIDGDDLVRRVVVEAGGGADRLQVDVTDPGIAVDVQAPPADQVTMLG